MKNVKVLLVGIGGYGCNFVNDLLDSPNEKFSIEGVVDPYPERCYRLDDIKKNNIPIYSTMEEFYDKHVADLAVIATPIFLHTKNILTALNNNSNVMCEKPLCADKNDINILREASNKSEKFVYVGYQWAYSDAVTNLKNDVINGRFGSMQEMKSLVLRPRDRNYFNRGVGWAGKIKMDDGTLILDSIANNSAAHYVFDMLFLMGEQGDAAAPVEFSAELFRANSIENYDTAKFKMIMPNGGVAHFIGAHPVIKELGPLYIYKFEKATVAYSLVETEDSKSILPSWYSEFGQIVAYAENDEKIVYGNPMDDECKKLHMAIDAIYNNEFNDGPCGINASGAFATLINDIQNKEIIHNVNKEYVKEDGDLVYVDGLYEAAINAFKQPEKSLLSFAE